MGKIKYSPPMALKKTDILEIICPVCGQKHQVPRDRFPADFASAKTQCAKCLTTFSLSLQNAKLRKAASGPNIKVLGFILAIIVILLVGMFFVYRAAESDRDSSLKDLPEQVKIALFGESSEGRQDRLEGLVIAVKEGYKLIIKDKKPVLVVKGTVTNPGQAVRTRILLEGRIVDKSGEARFTTRAPCSRTIADKRLKQIRRGEFSRLFARNKEYVNCTLMPGEKKPFQMIFDDIPQDYAEDYTVQVKTLLAGHERALDPAKDIKKPE